MSSSRAEAPILVLGAGINGAAIARELALAGEAVIVVDRADIATGTTSYSSRLIHGGLRYLEHREFDLVRESLAERTRLLRLAPDFVHPLVLSIPVQTRFGGVWPTLNRFLGREVSDREPRGLWLVRAGLWFYDRYARDNSLPRHRVHRTGSAEVPRVDRARYRWLCSYCDAQIQFPERFTIALLKDAQDVADKNGKDFQVFTYQEVSLNGRRVTSHPKVAISGSKDLDFEPAAIINATGAWVDDTLARLNVAERQLIAGTKGSHYFTWNRALRSALNGGSIYAEASDGRPVFILPLGGGTLVGTTDLPFAGDPGTARAEPHELEYLRQATRNVFPDVDLSESDIAWHYCGVRPLPYVDAASPAAITRRHWLHEHPDAPLPLYSVIGGKLTTCRSLAEEVVKMVLGRLGRVPWANSRVRPIPELAGESFTRGPGRATRDLAAVRRLIDDEWVCTLGDLVERRLMLLYDRDFSRDDLRFLAEVLAAAGRLNPAESAADVERCEVRLRDHFGFRFPEA